MVAPGRHPAFLCLALTLEQVGRRPGAPDRLREDLVGLLIADWRRRYYKHRSVYACPTNQLAHQVWTAAQAQGIPAALFIGSRPDFNDRDLARYEGAEAARLSVRGLQAAYQRHGLGSPMRQLKEARLRRARTELRTANPGATTVSAVAGRWGFTNVGRFAADYRRMFGTTPGRDLAGE